MQNEEIDPASSTSLPVDTTAPQIMTLEDQSCFSNLEEQIGDLDVEIDNYPRVPHPGLYGLRKPSRAQRRAKKSVDRSKIKAARKQKHQK